MSETMQITITGTAWQSPQSPSERQTMAVYVKLAGEPKGRCPTCAFTPGTDANRSRMVLHLVESCMLDDGNTFMCHHGLKDDEEPHRPCAGFVALRNFTPAAHD